MTQGTALLPLKEQPSECVHAGQQGAMGRAELELEGRGPGSEPQLCRFPAPAMGQTTSLCMRFRLTGHRMGMHQMLLSN